MQPTRPTRPLLALALALPLLSCAAAPHADERGSAPLRGPSINADGRRVPSAETLLAMAHVLAARGNDSRCEVVLNELVETHPGHGPGWNELAELYLRHDRVEDAVLVLEKGVAAVPEDPVLWNNLGISQLLARRYGHALPAFAEAVRLDPRNLRTRANLALAYGLCGRLDESLAHYLEAVPARKARRNVAVLAEIAGDVDRAEMELLLSRAR